MKKVVFFASIFVLLIVFGVIWFGMYNIAANDKHYAITEVFLELLRERSIKARSKHIKIPELDNPELINAGAKYYTDMCSSCHLSPGMSPTELSQGLYPQPPNFSQPRHSHHTIVFRSVYLTSGVSPACQLFVHNLVLPQKRLCPLNPYLFDIQIMTSFFLLSYI